MQSDTRKETMRRGAQAASSHHAVAASAITMWLRLSFLLFVLFVVALHAMPAYGAPTARVDVTADVQPSFKLTVVDDGFAVASNVPWMLELWQADDGVRVAGQPTARGLVACSGAECVTVVLDAPATR